MNIKTICESLKKKRVIRKGHRTIKYVTDKDGYKVLYNKKTGQAREIRMDAKEIRNRMMASLRSKSKRAAKAGQSSRKRSLSMKKRKGW